MNNNLNLTRIGPNQLGFDNGDMALIGAHRAAIDYGYKRIEDAKRSIKQEKRDMAEFIARRINKADNIGKCYGACIQYEDMWFICGEDLKFRYVEIGNEI